MSKTVIIPEGIRPTKAYLNEILRKMDKLGYVRFGDPGINELYCKLHRKNNYVYVTENPCIKPRTLVMTYENWADLYLMGYDTEYITPKEAEEINKIHNKEDLSSVSYDDLRDIYMCPNIEDFMIEEFGHLMDVSEMIFKSDQIEKDITGIINDFKIWKEKEQKNEQEKELC